MFTGIVEELGAVESIESRPAGARLKIHCQKVLADMTEGASIAVNGVCLTAVDLRPASFSADLAPETLRRSNLGAASPCGAPNPSCPAAVLDVALPPPNRTGLPPSAASNSGPYPGPAAVLSQLVRYVCKSKLVRRLTPAGTPANVRLPVLSRRVPMSTCCWIPSLTAGIRLVAVIVPTAPYALSNAV